MGPKTYLPSSSLSSLRRSIISLMGDRLPVWIWTRRRTFSANFRISARLFLDPLAGDLSSRKVSSRTWCRRFSTLQWFRLHHPIFSALISLSDMIPTTWISVLSPSPFRGAGCLTDPSRKNCSLEGVISFPSSSFTIRILICSAQPTLFRNGHCFSVFNTKDASFMIL